MKSVGLNHVRVPVGYWAVEMMNGDPYVDGQLDVLDWIVRVCEEVGLWVWIDLHGGMVVFSFDSAWEGQC
jgi:glucan 1,3-beta-glucosidase